MKHINENSSHNHFQSRDNTRGLPFYGQKGDFNFVTGRSQFTPGISIKQLPLADMSRNGEAGVSEFDNNINTIKRYFKNGDRIRGILVNSQIDGESGRVIIGRLNKVLVNRRDNTIKIFIIDPKTTKISEVYVDTIERLFESNLFALSFSEFLLS